MYYIENENKEIITYDEDLEKLTNTVTILPDYSPKDIKIVPDGYVIDNFKLMTVEEYDNKAINQARENKYKEALQGAKDYIANEAYYRYDDNNTIEATDGNIGKLTSYAMALNQGLFTTVTWTSKEDNVLNLNLEDVTKILTGLGGVQADIWNVQFVAYKKEIENAETKEDVNKIEIIYNSEGINADTSETTAADTVSDEVEAKTDSTKSE